jgi:hypothetical protein
LAGFCVCTLAGILAATGALDNGAAAAKTAGVKKPMDLFKYVDAADLKLNQKQENILNLHKKSPAAMNVRLIEFDREALKRGGPLRLPLPGRPLEIDGYELVIVGGVTKLKWKAAPNESVNLYVTDKTISGLIYAGKEVFSVEAVSPDVQALIQLDQSKFKERK